MKQYKKTLIITSIVTLLPIVVGVILWSRLPDTVATHFGFDGKPNGWSSKLFAVLGIPLFCLGVHLPCACCTILDPKRQNIGRKVYKLVFWICPVASIVCCLGTYFYALGWKINISDLIFVFLGILFVAVGNYLPKSRQNYTVGIKLPWTLADAENWNRTHRLAGKLWMIGGLLLIISSFLKTEWMIWAVLAVMVGVPVFYSFVYYIRHQKHQI